jgi:quercetin dioxygenase-like cupin family protein
MYPGINTQGITHARLDFAIGGVFPLHSHPRAAETLFVLKGSVYTGFVSDDNVLYASTLYPGDVIIFPRGLLHFQLNVGNETAITFNTLTSQSPGFLITVNQVRVCLFILHTTQGTLSIVLGSNGYENDGTFFLI